MSKKSSRDMIGYGSKGLKIKSKGDDKKRKPKKKKKT